MRSSHSFAGTPDWLRLNGGCTAEYRLCQIKKWFVGLVVKTLFNFHSLPQVVLSVLRSGLRWGVDGTHWAHRFVASLCEIKELIVMLRRRMALGPLQIWNTNFIRLSARIGQHGTKAGMLGTDLRALFLMPTDQMRRLSSSDLGVRAHSGSKLKTTLTLTRRRVIGPISRSPALHGIDHLVHSTFRCLHVGGGRAISRWSWLGIDWPIRVTSRSVWLVYYRRVDSFTFRRVGLSSSDLHSSLTCPLLRITLRVLCILLLQSHRGILANDRILNGQALDLLMLLRFALNDLWH